MQEARWTNEQNWYLRPSDFLGTLSPDDRAALNKIARRHEHHKGSHIFEAGNESKNVYLLEAGRVKIYQISPSGREVIHWFCFPGELLGLADISRGATRNSFAQACTGSTVISIDKNRFLEFMAARPMVALNAIDVLSTRLRRLGGALLDVATGDVVQRLGRLVMGMAYCHGRPICTGKLPPPEMCVNIALTHQDIADMISSSRQTVTTHLNEFKKAGWIHWQDRHIHVDRPDLLSQMLAEHSERM